jgi:hypothetical protein
MHGYVSAVFRTSDATCFKMGQKVPVSAVQKIRSTPCITLKSPRPTDAAQSNDYANAAFQSRLMLRGMNTVLVPPNLRCCLKAKLAMILHDNERGKQVLL